MFREGKSAISNTHIFSITVCYHLFQLVFPVEELLYPEETDSTIIMYMCRHLLAGTITLRRNHLLYVVAIHHVNRYMYTNDGKAAEIKQGLLKSAGQCTVEVRIRIIILIDFTKFKVCIVLFLMWL